MNDETIILMVLAATLGTFLFMAAQLRARRPKHQHSLGDMPQPPPKHQPRPTASE